MFVLQRGKSFFTRVILNEDTTFPECTRAIVKARLDKVVPDSQRVLLEPDIRDSALGHGLIIVVRMLSLTAQDSTYESHQLLCDSEGSLCLCI